MQLYVLNIRLRVPPTALLTIFPSFFIVGLKVRCDHTQKHEGTNTALLRFVKVATFSEETLEHKVEWS